MIFGFKTLPIRSSPEAQKFRPRPGLWLPAAAVCIIVILIGTLIVNLQARDIEAQHEVDLLVQASAVRARLSREINKVLYLTSGLSSYLAVRHNNLQRTEVEAILAALYRDSPHIRNFGIAVGYRVTYVHPLKGNEKAIGLYYPDLKDQWPAIERTVETGQPSLTGPLKLVQGGTGFIYRVPIFINDKYWGLLSSVIDAESLLSGALNDNSASGLVLAIRSKDRAGALGAVFSGEAALFDDSTAHLFEVDVPGGKWIIALRSTEAQGHGVLLLLHGLVWLLALTLGWSALVVLTQRAKLTQLALFDPLTKLPNRLLADDRISLALSGLHRGSSRTCLLLFIDLDGFKLINDRYGHKAGDAALQSAASRAKAAVRDIDTVSRWGGDEFIVFMENVDRSKLDEIVGKIRNTIEMPITFGTHELKVGASIGSVFAPGDGITLDELVRKADERMYADKASRRAVR